MRCPRCQQDNPSHANFCLMCGTSVTEAAPARPFPDPKDQNEGLRRALAAAHQQQTATAEILRVISTSPSNAQPVFDTIIRNSVRVCGGMFGIVVRFDGELIHFIAHHPFSPDASMAYGQWFPRRAADDHLIGPAVIERRIMNVPDVAAKFRFVPAQREHGFHSVLVVPMLHDGVSIGAIAVSRTEIGAFPEHQVEILKTFADQAVIAIENVRLFNETKEALDQQTATAEILGVISSSPTDAQPVFTALAISAARLCDAFDAAIHRMDGDVLRLVAHDGPIEPDALLPLQHGTLAGQVVRERRAIQVGDMQAETHAYPLSSEFARNRGFRTILSVPLLREAEVLGIITIRRTEVRLFTDKQAELLRTFADQAVIAIENVRLFKELQEKNRALTEAHAQVTESLERQMATSEILRVISQSPTDVQPVFDAIVRSGAALCHAPDVIILMADGDSLRIAASVGSVASSVRQSQLFQGGGLPLTRGSVSGRAFIDRRTVHVRDVSAMPDNEFPEGKMLQTEYGGHGTTLAVPLLREDRSLGVITLVRNEVSPFTDRQVALLQTFANQAVIAIENVRMFTETKEALERQTATAEILRVIAASPTELQPVLDTIVRNAANVCGAFDAILALADGDSFVTPAHHGPIPPPTIGKISMRGTVTGLAIREARTVHVADLLATEDFPTGRDLARTIGYRTVLCVPLLRDDAAIGAIGIRRTEVRPFTDTEMALLQTFADQAVIAIENVRLFKELEARNRDLTEALDQQTATSEILRVISGSPTDVQPVFDAIAASATRLCEADFSGLYQFDGTLIHFSAQHGRTPEEIEAARQVFPQPLGRASVSARAILDASVVQVGDVSEDPEVADGLRALFRTVMAVPMMRDGRPIGTITVARRVVRPFSDEQIALLKTFADQAVIAIENVRLFRELEVANRELAAASQHKSEFLANMSHELRTPLNAIIGFSEVLTDRMFGDLNEKQEEYLKDIYASGTHLLSLINDILDLSKIEAGRMELELTDFDLPTALDNALTLVRERAGRRSLTLDTKVDGGVGQVRADERKIRQVVLNLLSNAIKFTPEGGRIEVVAVSREGSVEISVTDTGVGIALEDQEAVFEEFRQVGTAEKKAEGTGLGLTLCRKFIELHGGRIWVTSQVGVGATFTFTIPVLRGE
jgi:signal transduction histidine kinase